MAQVEISHGLCYNVVSSHSQITVLQGILGVKEILISKDELRSKKEERMIII